MEELVSTDNIHREILDDAKRKAAKILKNAEGAIAAAAADWDAKLQKAVDEVRARYDAEITGKQSEAKARLAMDKARAKLSHVTGELEKAMRGFFRTLPRNETLAVLERALSVRLAAVKAARTARDGARAAADFPRLAIETSGLTKAETETILGHLSLTADRIDEYAGDTGSRNRASTNSPLSQNETSFINELPAIMFWAGDIKITASIQAEADAMLLSKRAEAAEALFG
jgi:hypothetical protein